jgi:hypothetical protein
LAFLNSTIVQKIIQILNPTLVTTIGDLEKLPIMVEGCKVEISKRLIEKSKLDWDAYETSWDFTENPLIHQKQNTPAATISPVIPARMPESVRP